MTAKKAAPKKAAKTSTKKASTKKAATKAIKKVAAKKAAPKKTAAKTTVKKAVKKTDTAKKAATSKKTKLSPKPQSKNKPTSKKSSEEEVKTSTAEQQPQEEKPKIAQARRPTRKIPTKRANDEVSFKVKELVIYPAHGVGIVIAIEKQTILDQEIELYVIHFEHEKMKLRVPTNRAGEAGMRSLSTPDQVDKILAVLEGKARIKRTMWSRRAKEYEDKINSGDLRMVAEVVRDLYRSVDQPEQSYSERQLFEQAVDRMAREVCAVRKGSHEDAVTEMYKHLNKKAAVIAAAAAAAAQKAVAEEEAKLSN
ncbi:MAG: CarD family transcriptional regulator [bacterium]